MFNKSSLPHTIVKYLDMVDGKSKAIVTTTELVEVYSRWW